MIIERKGGGKTGAVSGYSVWVGGEKKKYFSAFISYYFSIYFFRCNFQLKKIWMLTMKHHDGGTTEKDYCNCLLCPLLALLNLITTNSDKSMTVTRS